MVLKPLQTLFKGSVLKTIERLKRNSGVKHRGEVIRDAIKLYDVIDKFTKSGKIVIEEGTRKKKLSIPRKKKWEGFVKNMAI